MKTWGTCDNLSKSSDVFVYLLYMIALCDSKGIKEMCSMNSDILIFTNTSLH